MAKIIDGKAISAEIKEELKQKVAQYKNQGIDITRHQQFTSEIKKKRALILEFNPEH